MPSQQQLTIIISLPSGGVVMHNGRKWGRGRRWIDSGKVIQVEGHVTNTIDMAHYTIALGSLCDNFRCTAITAFLQSQCCNSYRNRAQKSELRLSTPLTH